MSELAEEFVYRLPIATSGSRPGAHAGHSRGAGMNFAAHARLFDQPDPRRLDLRASITDVRGDWLVRTYQQPGSITVHVLVDLSASMHFGNPGKLQVIAQFLESLGLSAHAYGDAVSLLPFDSHFRQDLYIPPRRGRALGSLMANTILGASTGETRKRPVHIGDALQQAANQIAGSSGMIFLASDFHWNLDEFQRIANTLSSATLVPLVVWDKAESTPPEAGQLLFARDIESDSMQQVWINERNRAEWTERVSDRRQQLKRFFAASDCRALFIDGQFNSEQVSRYFMESV